MRDPGAVRVCGAVRRVDRLMAAGCDGGSLQGDVRKDSQEKRAGLIVERARRGVRAQHETRVIKQGGIGSG